MRDVINSLTPAHLPILPHIVGSLSSRPGVKSLHKSAQRTRSLVGLNTNPKLLREVYIDIVNRFTLNLDQQRVLSSCVQWFIDGSLSPITLVHGVFGSGKSHMLVAIIVFLHTVLEKVDPERKIRILISAQTNVAVDRVLTGLLDCDFSLFSRVGSLKKISKRILSNVIHFSDKAKNEADHGKFALQDLQTMLKNCSSPAERKSILAAIKQTQTASDRKELKGRRVIGRLLFIFLLLLLLCGGVIGEKRMGDVEGER